MIPGAELDFGMIVPDEAERRDLRFSSSTFSSTGFPAGFGAGFLGAVLAAVPFGFSATIIAPPVVTIVPDEATRRAFSSAGGVAAAGSE